MSQISQIKKIYHAAIYVRLSKEDGAVASHEKTESNSIANQKSLIRDFLENKNDIEVVQEYVDDGFSGSNFERPAFQMMLEDIKKGKIDCVVTKDLSRFGREYIDSGMYIERLFPAMGVRFIAINDGIDSGEAKSQSDEIIIPFKNLINDAYCRDISIKIRSHLEIKRKQGDVITAFVPYGYKKNDKDKHKLEIDVYAANVVKDIFRMKLHGKSQDAIACELNSSGILPPAEYKASTGSNYQTCFKTKEKSEWTSVMVRRILTNEVYIGNLVQGKQTTPNHKVKKTIIKEKCEWIRIEKNHEPVITDRDFEVVQRLLAMDTRTSPDREEVYPLSGVVTCGGCGIPMVRKTSKVSGKTYAYYLCATHKDSKQCSSHRISTDKLEEVVLELLQTHIDNMIDLKRILSFIGNVPFQQLDMKKLEERREKKQAEVDRCADLRGMLYEDMKDGIISKEDYKELHAAYEQRKKNAEIAIHQIELEMDDVLNRKSKGFVWLDYFTEHKNIEKLTREVVVSLIREIKVFDKNHMIHDIRAGKINTVITRDLSRLGRNYVEAGNYIERVFPFLDVRYIAITDDFDTARPGTDLSVPFKNIVNEYYSKDLSKKVETGKHSIWAQGGFSEGTPPYGYYRATDGSRKLLIDEEVSDNVVRIFNMFLDGKGYAGIAKTLQYEGILSPPKYRFYKSGKIELAEKAREWHYSHVKEILQGEYYIGNIVHGKQRKALDTGRKNVKTDASTWQRIENVHEPIIDKDTFYKTRERMEHIKKKHLEASKPKADVPNKPDNILVYKTKCACCGGSVLIGRHHTYSEKFYYKCKNRRKLARLCENKYSYDYSEVMDSVFSVIRQHMSLCVEKTKFVQKMNSRKENVLQYDIYTKQIAKLQNDVRRITANKSGLYEDYREQLITAEELCQYQREYESRVNEIEAQITELLHRRSLYEKEFHIDEGWEETVNKYMAKRKLTKELVDAFVSEIVFYDGNIEVKLLYDDFLKELLKVAEEREVSSNG